jgi:hypothetical protein
MTVPRSSVRLHWSGLLIGPTLASTLVTFGTRLPLAPSTGAEVIVVWDAQSLFLQPGAVSTSSAIA